MELAKSKAAELALSNLTSVFNERDPQLRRKAIEATYSTKVTLYEPDNVVVGHDAIDQVCQKLLDSSPGWEFKPTGSVKCNHNMITMPWSFGPSDDPEKLTGSDVLLVGEDSLVEVVYVVIDAVSSVPFDT